MSGHRKWSEIRNKAHDSPEARAEIEQEMRIMEAITTLHQAREQRGVTQTELARALDVSQANVSRTERKQDLFLSTIRRYVEALGGELEVRAIFPDQTVTLSFPHVERGPRKQGDHVRSDEPTVERKTAAL